MKRIVRKQVLWECSVCKTAYPNKKDAAHCEKVPLEEKKFKIGDRVQNILPRRCQKRLEDYTFSGRVVKIAGPRPHYLGCRHVFDYMIEYVCPRCKITKEAFYEAWGLKLIR